MAPARFHCHASLSLLLTARALMPRQLSAASSGARTLSTVRSLSSAHLALPWNHRRRDREASIATEQKWHWFHQLRPSLLRPRTVRAHPVQNSKKKHPSVTVSHCTRGHRFA
ncbi:hypothetical protein TRVL_07909 [Trypanosoma vivax]|nr:hypothetical protein TRVL_07909 [Trypanosoma vivax]